MFEASLTIFVWSPDGVLVWATWKEEEERTGQHGRGPCVGLVPRPTT